MTRLGPDTDELLRRTSAGDGQARGALLQRHRKRLVRMVRLRMDPRLAARLDPSDVVQDALAEADRRLDDYVSERPLPFYPWLRQFAWDRLVEQHRRHVFAGRRTVQREEAEPFGLPNSSALELADHLLDQGATPIDAMLREESRRRVRQAVAQLGEPDREVLALRYLEQQSAREVAAVLGISEAAAKKRALRALQRLKAILKDNPSEDAP
jgi:RNA polymerase sigma-70 factor (ECF subfamily)